MSNVLLCRTKSVQEYKNMFIISGIWLTVWMVANLGLLHSLMFFA
ncbi:hypothetical protein [Rheinheimera sediminis]|nr:hypothetical protein [Rheinheimera sp. YQF-1]